VRTYVLSEIIQPYGGRQKKGEFLSQSNLFPIVTDTCTSSEAIATGGLPSGRIPMNVQISTEEISGVNFHSLQNLIIAGNNTKI